MNSVLLEFPSDVPFRRQLQPPGARRHPGKLHLGFLAALLDAYAPRGGRLCDPFAGSGSLLLATLPPWGCDVVLNELEPPWAAQCRAAWAWMQSSPAQPRGTATIREGDARDLGAGRFDALITSPPWADMITHNRRNPADRLAGMNPKGSSVLNSQGFDALVTSPPFADALSHQRHAPTDQAREARYNGKGGAASRTALREGYGGTRNPAQIGNLAGARYWAAMDEVWTACVPLIQPGGHVVVVLKNIVRGNQEVDLIGGTRSQLENLGLIYVATVYRAVQPGPFHRIRRKHNPAALIIDREAALVLRVPPPL